MKKKATLLIKNIEKIYTLHNSRIYKHAFLAIHHEFIIGIGTDHYQSFIDKDTRIIDAREHFVIPAFIEINAEYPITDQWNKPHVYASFRNECMRHGILTLAMNHNAKYVEVDIVKKELKRQFTIVGLAEVLNQEKNTYIKPFCISTKDSLLHVTSPLLLAQMLYRKYNVHPIQLIKAMTLYPAKMLGLEKLGTIQIGNQADLVICRGNDISCLFHEFSDQNITQIIKKGVRIYPYLLRS